MGSGHNADVQSAVLGLAALAGTLQGIRKGQAYDMPPDRMAVFPAAMCYAGAGEERREKTLIRREYTLVCEIHYPRKSLPRAVTELMPYVDDLPAAIWANPTLNGTVTGVLAVAVELDWEREYNGVETLALKVSVDVVMHHS